MFWFDLRALKQFLASVDSFMHVAAIHCDICHWANPHSGKHSTVVSKLQPSMTCLLILAKSHKVSLFIPSSLLFSAMRTSSGQAAFTDMVGGTIDTLSWSPRLMNNILLPPL
jgi:hypothetical protein